MTSVYVLVANENEKVKECIVLPNDEQNVEFGVRHALFEIYGAANVCASSREIGHIPDNIARYLAEKSISIRKSGWKYFSGVSAPLPGLRVLVQFHNGYIAIATYYSDGISSTWKNDSGQITDRPMYWKRLEE